MESSSPHPLSVGSGILGQLPQSPYQIVQIEAASPGLSHGSLRYLPGQPPPDFDHDLEVDRALSSVSRLSRMVALGDLSGGV